MEMQSISFAEMTLFFRRHLSDICKQIFVWVLVGLLGYQCLSAFPSLWTHCS